MTEWTLLLGSYLVTYWLHSSCLLLLAMAGLKLGWIRADLRGETLIKSLWLAGVFTALVSLLGGPVKIPDWIANSPSDSAAITGYQKSMDTNAGFQSVPEFSHLPEQTPEVTQNKGLPVLVPINHIQEHQHEPAGISFAVSDEQSGIFFSLVVIWMVFVLLFVTKNIRAKHQLKQLIDSRQPITDPELLECFNGLLADARLPDSIRLSECPSINSPMVANCQEVIIPCRFKQQFSQQQVRAALAHELAHIKRRDPVWLNLGIWYQAIFFFQPLNRIIQKSIYQIAEHRSDRLSAKWTGKPRALVEALAVAASFHLNSSQTNMVYAMKSNKSHLIQRVEHILQASVKKTHRLTMAVSALFMVSLLVMVPGVSVMAEASSEQAEDKSLSLAQSSESHHSKSHASKMQSNKAQSSKTQSSKTGEGTRTFSMNTIDDDHEIKIKGKLSGKIQLNDSETAIDRFPQNSELKIVYDKSGRRHQLRVTRDTGAINYDYRLNGSRKEFDPEGKAWFASVLPEIMRRSGFNAADRVAKIYGNDGTQAVFNEINLIPTDYVKGLYLSHLFELAKLNSSENSKALEIVGAIRSDYEQGKVLVKMSQTQQLTQTSEWLAMLSATESISSDFEQAKTLKAFSAKMPEDSEVQKMFFQVAENINSDFEMSALFSELLAQKRLNDSGLLAMFRAAENISSDFELSNLLVTASDQVVNSPMLFEAYLEVSKNIGSDVEMRRAYAELLRENLEQNYLVGLLESASNSIGSDFELASLLVDVIDQYPMDDVMVDAIRDSASSIGSRYERKRVMERLSQS